MENENTTMKEMKTERKKRKLKVLKDENKHLRDLLKQIGSRASNRGLLSAEQQLALAEAIAHEDSEMLDADQSMEAVDSQGNIEFAASPDSKFEPPNSGTSKNPTMNNGFQFSHHKSSAVVMPSVKQTPGSNFFLNGLGEVVKDLDSADEIDVTNFDIKSMREQICFRSCDFAPISPLPPTPPPKTIENTPEDSKKPSEETRPSISHQSERRTSSKKKHSFNHQQSTGFDEPSDQNTARLNATAVTCSSSAPAPSISEAGFGKYEFVSKRSAEGGVMLTFSLKDDISLNVDSNTWQITCHIPEPKRKLPECSVHNRFEAPAPPSNRNFASAPRNIEDGCVPFKRQKLSFSEEVPEMVLPSMHGIDIGNFGKKKDPESGFLAPSNRYNHSNNSAFLLKEHSSFNQVAPSYPQDTNNLLNAPSVATTCCKSSHIEALSKSSEVTNPSLKPNAKIKSEMVSPCFDNNVDAQNNTVFMNEEVSLLSVAVSSEMDVSAERNPLSNYSLKKRRKRSVANVKDSRDCSFENNLKVSSTYLKTHKQTSQKQKMPFIPTDAYSSNSLSVKVENNQPYNKSPKKLLKKVQKVESEESTSAGNSQGGEDIVNCPSKKESVLGSIELDLSSKQSSSNESRNESFEMAVKRELSEKEERSTLTKLDSQEKKRNNFSLEKSVNSTAEIEAESMTLLKEPELSSSSELSSPKEKQSTQFEGINQLTPENEVEGKIFLRTLGLISSSELGSQDDQSCSLSSSNKNGEIVSSPESSAPDVNQSTPKKEGMMDKLEFGSSREEVSPDEKKKDSPQNLNFTTESEDVVENSKQCQFNVEKSSEKESSFESMECSLSENKAIKESSVNEMRLRSSSNEEKVCQPIEAISPKRTFRKRIVKENQQNASLGKGPLNKKKGGRNNAKCPTSQNDNLINFRLRSSNQESLPEKKESDFPNKTSANKGKKKSKISESSFISEASPKNTEELQSRPEVAKCLRSVNIEKKESKLPNKKRQCLPKTLKRRRTAKMRSKTTIINTVSDSESESEITLNLSDVNDKSTASTTIVPDNSKNQKTSETNIVIEEMNETNTEPDNGVEDMHTCEKGKLGNTLSSPNNSVTAEHTVPISLNICESESNKELNSTSADSVNSNSLLKCKQKVTSPATSSESISALNIKKESTESPPETYEMNLSEIELDSFNPNAFAFNHGPDDLLCNVSAVQSTDLLSSKNLLTDAKFSFLNSNSSFGKLTTEDGKQKKSNSGFSFLDSNAFSREIFNVPIKKELLDTKKDDFTPQNLLVSKAEPQISETLLSESSPNAELGLKNSLEQDRSIESSYNPNFRRSSEKEMSETCGLKSSRQEQSSSLNSEENEGNLNGRNEDSDDGALVIADDAEPELPESEPEKNDSSDEDASISMPDAKTQPSVAPRKRKRNAKRRKNRRTSSTDSNNRITETGIDAAFKHLDKMKYSDAHSNYNTHFLYSAFINPLYTLDYIIYFVIKHLSTSKRNPLLSYSLNRDSPLLPLPEKCIVTALFKASSKPRLEKLLPSTKRSMYNIILAKQKLSIYGLCSLCRVFTEICMREKDKREVISLCCDLVLRKHKFAVYMIASINALWKDLFTPSEPSSEEEKMFFGAIAMAVLQKPKTLTQTQWNHCSIILSETMTVKLPSDIKSTVEFLQDTIRKKCLKGKFTNTVGLTKSLIMIAQMQEWNLTKELILNNFVIPCLKEFSSEENDERAFSLFCSLYGDISALSPDSEDPKNLLIHLFETKAGTHVQVSAAVTLLQLYLAKREAFPEFLGTWLTANHSHPKVAILSDLFHQSLIADNELLQTDVAEC